ncbi:MAG: ATP-binding protein [Snowella sp.]|nr:ATP-binding protein [Snowella sp.]
MVRAAFFNYLMSWFQRQTRLRNVLLVPFTVQLVGAVSLVGFLWFLTGNQAVNDLAVQLQGRASKQVEEHLNNYFENPRQVIQLMVNAVQSGRLDLSDHEATEKFLWQLAQIYPKVSYLNYGLDSGLFMGVGRANNFSQKLYIEEALPESMNVLNQYESLSEGKRGKLLKTLEFGDFHDQVWYRQPKEAGRFVWTEIYNWTDNPEIIVIGSGQPIYDRDRRLLGVVEVDLFLANIQDYLRSLKVTPNSKVFIIQPDGLVVATSDQHPPFKLEGNTATRLNLINFPEPLIQASGRYLKQKWGGFQSLKSPQILSFQWQGKRQLMGVSPWQDGYGLNLLIGVIIPESDFTQAIEANTNRTTLLSLVALIVALIIGNLTAHWITDPILRLNRASRAMTTHNFDGTELDALQSPSLRDRRDEVGELAEAFNQMASRLKSSFQALQADQQRLIDFLEAIPVSIVIHHADGSLFYMNKTGRALMMVNWNLDGTEPFPQSYALYRTSTQQIYPEPELPFHLARQGQSVFVEDLELHTPEAIIPLQATATPLLSGAGTVEYTITVFQDISQRRQVEHLLTSYNQDLERQVQERTQDLETAKEAAEIANRVKGEFLANVSHEIRTPMNSILGFCEILQGITTDPRSQGFLQAINSSSKTLMVLINDILDLSKIEAGKLQLYYEAVDVRQLISEIQHIFSQKVNEKKIQLLTEIELNVPKFIIFDEIRLRQILFNIVGNAIKFTDRGFVKITVTSESLSTQEVQLILKVQDTGIGIAKENHDRIFDVFTQSEGQSTRKYGGTGLGLTITRRLVEMLGGSIELESTVGQGTTFSLLFPCVKVEHKATITVIQPKEQDLQQFAPATILVVDDVKLNRDLLCCFFQDTDHHILEATNGLEAITMAKKYHPDLIIMDILMPILDGKEATFALKNDPETATIPIIILTASVLMEDRVTLEKSCKVFLSKPLRKTDLVNALRSTLPLRQVSSERDNSEENCSPQSLLVNTSSNSSFNRDNLVNLIAKIETEEKTIWPELHKKMIMKELREFAQRLQNWSIEYQSSLLQQYVNQLKTNLLDFDGENLEKTVQDFPRLRVALIAELEQYQEPHSLKY